MSGHTPGPWRFHREYSTVYVEADAVIDKRLTQEICAVGPVESGRAQQEANARLIAAAPDLLEALQALLAAVEGVPCGPEAQCRAAIARATGEAE